MTYWECNWRGDEMKKQWKIKDVSNLWYEGKSVWGNEKIRVELSDMEANVQIIGLGPIGKQKPTDECTIWDTN